MTFLAWLVIEEIVTAAIALGTNLVLFIAGSARDQGSSPVVRPSSVAFSTTLLEHNWRNHNIPGIGPVRLDTLIKALVVMSKALVVSPCVLWLLCPLVRLIVTPLIGLIVAPLVWLIRRIVSPLVLVLLSPLVWLILAPLSLPLVGVEALIGIESLIGIEPLVGIESLVVVEALSSLPPHGYVNNIKA